MPPYGIMPVGDESIMAHILHNLDQLRTSIGEVKAEMVAVQLVGQKTLEQATRTNGRLSKAESRLDEHDEWHVVAEATASGRKAQRDDDIAKLDLVTSIFDRYWKYAVMVALAGALVFDIGWRIYDVRPW